jgi:hypothetical protein
MTGLAKMAAACPAAACPASQVVASGRVLLLTPGNPKQWRSWLGRSALGRASLVTWGSRRARTFTPRASAGEVPPKMVRTPRSALGPCRSGRAWALAVTSGRQRSRGTAGHRPSSSCTCDSAEGDSDCDPEGHIASRCALTCRQPGSVDGRCSRPGACGMPPAGAAAQAASQQGDRLAGRHVRPCAAGRDRDCVALLGQRFGTCAPESRR